MFYSNNDELSLEVHEQTQAENQMTECKNNHQTDQQKAEKEIENGILKAITDITNEEFWPEGADAYDIQTIITQLARSVAHMRDISRAENDRKDLQNNITLKNTSGEKW